MEIEILWAGASDNMMHRSRLKQKQNVWHGMPSARLDVLKQKLLMSAVAERLRRAYPALLERAGVGSIPANSDAQNVPSFRLWRFEMKLSPF